jgi:hypothetical protein
MPSFSVEVARATFSDCCRETKGRQEVTTDRGKGRARAIEQSPSQPKRQESNGRREVSRLTERERL